MKRFFCGLAISVLVVGGSAIARSTTTLKAPTKHQSLQTVPVQSSVNPDIEWRQFIDAMFSPKAVKMAFNIFSRIGDKESSKNVVASGNIYYSKGELFVLYDKNSKGEPNTNFATINGKLYAWETGTKQGTILKRIDEDTEALLIYSVDPAGFKRATYFDEYRKQPGKFSVMQQGDIKMILLKQVTRPFGGIEIQENPFWLRSFIFCDCQSVRPTTPVSVFEVNRPVPLEKIPDSVKVLTPDVKFEPSETTVEYYLKYL
jgi:hypothetical protein